ncbi:hypothetical protein O181_008781 [Austropuccinia psidii MF-1]|uniref:Uncharacterized protein n=1 Tax=Austropuccinia psidii MF-1 TaxID=1389203 RepID=A0A9Q3BN42_9BASI|nr:hypothetical protein [Austropuccinia psidii MF-1]
MTNDNIKQFCLLMDTLVLPTGVSTLGRNIGSAKHGRLKASQWLSLYTLVIPLVFPEMYMDGHDKISIESNRGKFLQNTGDLVQCTRIACTRSLKDGHAGRFYNAYNRYTMTSKYLFNNPNIKPNHYYALHIPEQLKIWGPLMGVAEFAGERMIGLLQNIPTNQKIGEMHGSLLKKAHETQRLIGGHEALRRMIDRSVEGMKMGKEYILVNDNVYKEMLSMIRRKKLEVRDCADFPHPRGVWVLSRFANPIRSIVYD